MKYTRFEEIPVWQDAIPLAQAVFRLTRMDVFRHHWGLVDQLQRAAVSVSNNIAEGFERATVRELLAKCALCVMCCAAWKALRRCKRMSANSWSRPNPSAVSSVLGPRPNGMGAYPVLVTVWNDITNLEGARSLQFPVRYLLSAIYRATRAVVQAWQPAPL